MIANAQLVWDGSKGILQGWAVIILLSLGVIKAVELTVAVVRWLV